MRRATFVTTRAALALALVALFGGGAAIAPTASAAPSDSEITGGDFSWGVRDSIRNYLENFPHTEGSITASYGATYETGDDAIEFPDATGVVNVAEQTAKLMFNGEVEMRGFGESWLWFTDVRIYIADGKARMTTDMLESWQNKDGDFDMDLATFTVPTFTVVDGVVEATLTDGKFSKGAWDNHLPKLGGEPTYGPPNDQVDDATFRVTIDNDQSPEPTPTPTPTPTEPPTPTPTEPPIPTTPPVPPTPGGDGPYGVSTGAPLSGTGAYMTVTPGYALGAESPTTVTVSGYGFDPGPDVPPGTGTGGLYVGFGQAAEPGTENWRRSEGGRSGPEADFDYGLPRFVAHQNSADADVANAVMDSEGNWSFTAELPGSKIPSFFGGDLMDCIASECGVFAFGAHGAVNAPNEAYTSLQFQGADESNWPPRDGDDPEPPSETPQLPDEATLTSDNRGDVSVVETTPGQLTATVNESLAGKYVAAVLYSEPSFAGWQLVDESGRVRVQLPSDLAEGEHTLALLDTDGVVVGWTQFTRQQASPTPTPTPTPTPSNPTPNPDKEPKGESVGTNEFGATLTVNPAYELQDEGQVVTLRGSGYPTTSQSGNTFGGAYILFGWIDPEEGSEWGPSKSGRTGFSYVYVEGEENQSMVSYPGNTTVPGFPMMDANGNWEASYTIPSSTFTAFQQEIDCYKVQCGVITIGAHGQANSDLEVFTPVYFGVDGSNIDDDAKPTPIDGNGGPGATGQNPSKGNQIATGIVAEASGRTLVFLGIVVMAGGVFAGAIVWSAPRLRQASI